MVLSPSKCLDVPSAVSRWAMFESQQEALLALQWHFLVGGDLRALDISASMSALVWAIDSWRDRRISVHKRNSFDTIASSHLVGLLHILLQSHSNSCLFFLPISVHKGPQRA